MHHLLGTLLHFACTAVAVLLVAKILPGMKVKSFGSAFIFAIIVAIFNAVAWYLFGIFTIPFAILTAGIGYFIVNGVVFMLAASFSSGVQISGCITAVFASIGVGIVNWGIDQILPHHVR